MNILKLFFFCIMLTIVSSCETDSKIVGSWLIDSENTRGFSFNDLGSNMVFTFNSDGTYKFLVPDRNYYLSGKYKIESSKLILSNITCSDKNIELSSEIKEKGVNFGVMVLSDKILKISYKDDLSDYSTWIKQ
jgi:hypothetical protein